MSHPASTVLADLIGRPLHRLVRYEDGPIGLLVGEPGEPGEPYSYLLVVSAAWRLTDGDELLDGSYHEAEPDALDYADRLSGRQVDRVSVEVMGDAVISLGSLQVNVWSAAAKEPSLLWYRPGRESLLVSPGGVWSNTVLAPDDPLDEVGRVAIEAAGLPS